MLAAMSILLSLGVWQLRRLEWKRALIERTEAARTAAPLPLTAALARADPDFVRVTARCPALANALFVELYAVVDGQAGSRLISACPVEAGPYASILVDRGFVADTISWRPRQDGSGPPFTVTGVLQRPAEPSALAARDEPANRRFYSRRVAPIAASLNAPRPAPVFLMVETRTADSAALRPMATPTDLPNRHLEYALTWFGLAGALLAVYASLLIQDRRRPRGEAMSA